MDARTIQEVLQLHIDSSESCREMYVRVGTEKEQAYQTGFTDGLKRAIEVADYRAGCLTLYPNR